MEGKCTFSQAADTVLDVAKSSSVFVRNLDEMAEHLRGAVTTVPSSVQTDHFTVDNDGFVLTWDGPLRMYNMRGWRWDAAKGYFIRPLPLPPRRGFATRERISKFNWLPRMQDFVREHIVGHTVLTAPYADILAKMIGHEPT